MYTHVKRSHTSLRVIVYTHVKDHVVHHSMSDSEFDGLSSLWKYQNNPTCTKSVSLLNAMSVGKAHTHTHTREEGGKRVREGGWELRWRVYHIGIFDQKDLRAFLPEAKTIKKMSDNLSSNRAQD